jgi:hypothetical protein
MPLTFYARFGDMYGMACAIALGLWLAVAPAKRRRPGAAADRNQPC